jgi:hypothetical protein
MSVSKCRRYKHQYFPRWFFPFVEVDRIYTATSQYTLQSRIIDHKYLFIVMSNKKRSITRDDDGSQADPFFKRPRGRPPLVVSASKLQNPKSAKGTSKLAPLSGRVKNSSSTARDLLLEKGEERPTKDRQPASVTAQLIISKLMTDAPLRVTDFIKLIPDVQKDAVQSVLDILQVRAHLSMLYHASYIKRKLGSRLSCAVEIDTTSKTCKISK